MNSEMIYKDFGGSPTVPLTPHEFGGYKETQVTFPVRSKCIQAQQTVLGQSGKMPSCPLAWKADSHWKSVL